MTYDRIFSDIAKSHLQQYGFRKKDGCFFQYSPDQYVVKSIRLDMWAKRFFRVFIGSSNFVSGIHTINYGGKLHLALDCFDLARCLPSGVQFKAEANNYKEDPYSPEDFADDVQMAFKLLDQYVMQDYLDVRDISSELEFREKYSSAAYPLNYEMQLYGYIYLNEYEKAIQCIRLLDLNANEEIQRFEHDMSNTGTDQHYLQYCQKCVAKIELEKNQYQKVLGMLEGESTSDLQQMVHERIENSMRICDSFFGQKTNER